MGRIFFAFYFVHVFRHKEIRVYSLFIGYDNLGISSLNTFPILQTLNLFPRVVPWLLWRC